MREPCKGGEQPTRGHLHKHPLVALAGHQVGRLAVERVAAAAQEMLNRPLHLSEAAFTQAIDPVAAIAARQVIGGAAPEALSAMLVECQTALDIYSAWHQQATASAVVAEEGLLRRARQLCGGA